MVCYYCSLNIIDPHNIIRSDNIGKCSIVEMDMALLKEVPHAVDVVLGEELRILHLLGNRKLTEILIKQYPEQGKPEERL